MASSVWHGVFYQITAAGIQMIAGLATVAAVVTVGIAAEPGDALAA